MRARRAKGETRGGPDLRDPVLGRSPRRPTLGPGRQAHLPTISWTTYAATLLISSSERTPLKAGIPPPPLVTCLVTPASVLASGIVRRSGPFSPPWPVAPWQVEQFSENTSPPAIALPGPAAVFSLAPACSDSFSPACLVPSAWFSRPVASGIVPFSEKTQKASPCG